jgi:acyl carrier protein
MIHDDGTVEALRAFIIDELNWDGDPGALTTEYPLIDEHVVDSLGITLMLEFLQERFGIVVSDDELLPENFDSIGRITAFIEAKRSARR